MVRVALSGYGKVGQHVVAAAKADPQVELVAVIEHKDHPMVGSVQEGVPFSADLREIAKADVLIEFSMPAAVMEHLEHAARDGVPVLIATTGLTAEQKEEVKKAAERIPVLQTSNVTLGMNVLFAVLPQMAKTLLEAGWTGAITETHRAGKKDAPSGTALRLQDGIRQATGKEVPAFSIRAGNVVGVHRIDLVGRSGETIEITHRVQSREDFAMAAIALGKRLVGMAPGLYDGRDLVGTHLR